MKKTMENLWNNYLLDECAIMDTEERALLEKAMETQRAVNVLLTKEQNKAVEEYIEALYEIQSIFAKKAFFKGCEFATSFFLEALNLEKIKL